jgi:hypothetical protein
VPDGLEAYLIATQSPATPLVPREANNTAFAPQAVGSAKDQMIFGFTAMLEVYDRVSVNFTYGD